MEFVNTTFINNSLSQHSYKGIIKLNKVFATFSNCHFMRSLGTALQATESVVSLFKEIYFINNTGKEGGGISLTNSRLKLNYNSTTIFINNRADYGGGLFATPAQFENPLQIGSSNVLRKCNLCTLSLATYNLTELNNITVKFANNTSKYSGDSVFYGAFSNCCAMITKKCKHCDKYAFIKTDLASIFSVASKTKADISSIARSLRACEGKNKSIETFPGAAFNVSVRTKGEYTETAAVTVKVKLCHTINRKSQGVYTCGHDHPNELHYGAGKQVVTSQCSNLTFSVQSLQKKVYLELGISRLLGEIFSVTFYDRKYLSMQTEINLLPCPVGYWLESSAREIPTCKCIEYLSRQGINCNINQGGTILRPRRFWIGFHKSHPSIITLNKHCPFDYCKPSDSFLSLSSPNEQCNNNRTGVLCGACRKNLSLVLGTSRCKECFNVHLLLIIPFGLAGVALVVLLLKCNLTVSVGHINGIIFYANIVHVNKALLFKNENHFYEIFTTFIAWLNLDLGIETCFFKNMDTYSKVWLQFVFPVYLWVMIGFIVIVAHYSSRGGRLIGSNSVPVLATLFFLSYAKLLRTIIAAVSFTFIEFEDGSYITVWLHDANVRYLSPIHSALFCVAILFTLGYIIPLTFLFLLSPCLQSRSHKKAFKWVNRIKPFLDANQGPYSAKFRWWSGLLLILRIILYSIFSANYDNDPSMTFLWITLLLFPVSMFCLTKQRVYRHKLANYLESASLLNIVILSAANWFSATTEYYKWQAIGDYASCISIAFSMVLFILVVIYQLALKFHLLAFFSRKEVNKLYRAPSQNTLQENLKGDTAPTSSVVELKQRDFLREPLLDNQ